MNNFEEMLRKCYPPTIFSNITFLSILEIFIYVSLENGFFKETRFLSAIAWGR
ncbi:MAG: hypothetical protein ACKPGT_11550 [Microcystis sp.]